MPRGIYDRKKAKKRGEGVSPTGVEKKRGRKPKISPETEKLMAELMEKLLVVAKAEVRPGLREEVKDEVRAEVIDELQEAADKRLKKIRG